MQKLIIGLTVLLSVSVLICCTRENNEVTLSKSTELSNPELIKRGAYLVTVGGCNDCHSPKMMTDQGPAPDPKLLLSGHPSSEALPVITDSQMVAPGQWALFSSGLTAAVGPWGTSFAANLTPDDTGLGTWTEEQFFKAIREGKSKGRDGTRPLLPPMPWFNFAKMSDDDLHAVYAYLRSLPPVKNIVPNPIMK